MTGLRLSSARREPRPTEGALIVLCPLGPPSTSSVPSQGSTGQLSLTARLRGVGYRLCVGKKAAGQE